MTKKDLRTGYIVTTRNGEHFRVMLNAYSVEFMNLDVIISLTSTKWAALSEYDEDLNHRLNSEWDIVRIERPVFALGLGGDTYEGISKSTLWERPTYYNGKVVCVKDSNRVVTKGKIYEFKDGYSVNDLGLKLPLMTRVKSVEHLNEVLYSDFIEVVE